MQRLTHKQINTPSYWDKHQTALDFGLRQKKYSELAESGESIVELGCGLSPFLHYSKFKNKFGVDFSKETCTKAKEMYPDVEYKLANALNTGYDNNSFDVSVSGELIEHLEKPYKLIFEMARITKKGGKIIISSPVLEFKDPEHLWQLEEIDFHIWGFNTETIISKRFKGRKYIFAFKINK